MDTGVKFMPEIMDDRKLRRVSGVTTATSLLLLLITPPPTVSGTGIVYDRFLCFFVSKITRKLRDRFARNFQERCGVTMGRCDSILGHFEETARCRDAQHGAGFVVLSHHSLF